ncbi:MAG: MFS transporter [Hyphomonadaceae bacterium]|nr:MFS transporter [Hyphomonadaceae bacterium]
MRSTRLSGRWLVAAMCAGQVGNLLPHVVVPAVMPQHLMPLWQLSGSEAGMMAAAYALGYMLAVPFLTTLTDRIDARLILLGGSAVSGLATVAFGVLADGLASAALLWALAGIGFAGAYMPGLKALSDRLGPGDISRSVTLYTACFSLGVGLSFLVSQLAAEHLGWRAAFLITGLGPLAMVAACLALAPVQPRPSGAALLDFTPVLSNRAAMGYILGYGAHCFELYALRTWIVAFWAFVAARSGGAAVLEPVTVSVITALLAMPSSVLGNEAAIRFGRRRVIAAVMIVSGAVAVAIGIASGAATSAVPGVLLALLLVYAITVPADSGALTSGMTASANPAYRGATMAMHSTVGFGLSAAGGWAIGIALDAGGGPVSASGWLAAFAVMAGSAFLGPLALWWSVRARAAPVRTPE